MRILILLWVLSPSLGQAAEAVTADLLSDPFTEIYQPEVNVSGSVIVGVMSMSAGSALAADRLGIMTAPGVEGGEICLRATSSDGIYSSRNHYRLPGFAPGPVHVPYQSGMSHVLEDYPEGELAVSAAAGDCDSTSSEYYLVTSMEAEASPIRIYLNSFGATDVFYQVKGQQPMQLEACEYIAEGRRTTYDFYCTLPALAGDTVEVSIVRERFGREQPGVELKLIGMRQ